MRLNLKGAEEAGKEIRMIILERERGQWKWYRCQWAFNALLLLPFVRRGRWSNSPTTRSTLPSGAGISPNEPSLTSMDAFPSFVPLRYWASPSFLLKASLMPGEGSIAMMDLILSLAEVWLMRLEVKIPVPAPLHMKGAWNICQENKQVEMSVWCCSSLLLTACGSVTRPTLRLY